MKAVDYSCLSKVTYTQQNLVLLHCATWWGEECVPPSWRSVLRVWRGVVRGRAGLGSGPESRLSAGTGWTWPPADPTSSSLAGNDSEEHWYLCAWSTHTEMHTYYSVHTAGGIFHCEFVEFIFWGALHSCNVPSIEKCYICKVPRGSITIECAT